MVNEVKRGCVTKKSERSDRETEYLRNPGCWLSITPHIASREAMHSSAVKTSRKTINPYVLKKDRILFRESVQSNVCTNRSSDESRGNGTRSSAKRFPEEELIFQGRVNLRYDSPRSPAVQPLKLLAVIPATLLRAVT